MDQQPCVYEVELKFRLDEPADLEAALADLGCRLGPAERQRDVYFAHPARDYRATDEALRLRQWGAQCRLTYKGPRVDARTKTRQELELPLAGVDQPAQAWHQMLVALGFQPAVVVEKSRRTGHLDWEGQQVEVALDQVDRLGGFVELELSADQANRDAMAESLLRLSQQLGLSRSERRGYAELVGEL